MKHRGKAKSDGGQPSQNDNKLLAFKDYIYQLFHSVPGIPDIFSGMSY